jgi:hypothetical protein
MKLTKSLIPVLIFFCFCSEPPIPYTSGRTDFYAVPFRASVQTEIFVNHLPLGPILEPLPMKVLNNEADVILNDSISGGSAIIDLEGENEGKFFAIVEYKGEEVIVPFIKVSE